MASAPLPFNINKIAEVEPWHLIATTAKQSWWTWFLNLLCPIEDMQITYMILSGPDNIQLMSSCRWFDTTYYVYGRGAVVNKQPIMAVQFGDAKKIVRFIETDNKTYMLTVSSNGFNIWCSKPAISTELANHVLSVAESYGCMRDAWHPCIKIPNEWDKNA
jgi:hypothetical protein